LTLTFSTPGTLRAAAISALRSAGMLALAGVAELDVEGHVAVFDAQVLQLARADEIAPGVGVGDGLQRFEQRGFGDGLWTWAGLLQGLTVARLQGR
jgi:hypothetical protein